MTGIRLSHTTRPCPREENHCSQEEAVVGKDIQGILPEKPEEELYREEPGNEGGKETNGKDIKMIALGALQELSPLKEGCAADHRRRKKKREPCG